MAATMIIDDMIAVIVHQTQLNRRMQREREKSVPRGR